MSFKVLALLVFLVGICACEDLYSSCRDSYGCVEKKLIKLVDGFDGQSNVSVLGDMVTLNKNEEQFEAARAGEDLLERCARFLANREIRFKLPSDVSKSLIEGKQQILKWAVYPVFLLGESFPFENMDRLTFQECVKNIEFYYENGDSTVSKYQVFTWNLTPFFLWGRSELK